MFEGLKFSTTLPDGVYYNREPQPLLNTLFVDLIENKISTFKDLRHKPLHEFVYKRPNLLFPYINDNITNGSVFKDCFIPSCAYDIVCNNGLAEVKLHNPKPITKNEYIEIYYNLIKQEIQKIYEKHEIVVLQYSGGIDSILLLSFIINLKLLHKTILVTCENWFAPPFPDILRFSKVKRNLIDMVAKDFAGQYLDFVNLKFTDDDWIFIANNYTSFQIRSHTNFFVYEKFKNFAVIAGHYGDDILLHDDKWLEEIILKSSNINKSIEQCKILLKNKNLYINYYLDFDPKNKELTPLKDYTFFLQNWEEMTKPIYGGNYYSPIGVNTRLCRSIDITTIDMIDILDAQIPKEMIKKNVGSDLDKYIFHKSDNDGDYFHPKDFFKSKFNDSIFLVPKNVKHNKKALITFLLSDLNRKESNPRKFLHRLKINTQSIFSLHLLKTIAAILTAD